MLSWAAGMLSWAVGCDLAGDWQGLYRAVGMLWRTVGMLWRTVGMLWRTVGCDSLVGWQGFIGQLAVLLWQSFGV